MTGMLKRTSLCGGGGRCLFCSRTASRLESECLFIFISGRRGSERTERIKFRRETRRSVVGERKTKRDGESVCERLGKFGRVADRRCCVAPGVHSRFFFWLFVSFDKISKTFQVGAAHVRVFCPFFFFFKGCLSFCRRHCCRLASLCVLFFSSVFFSSLPQCRLGVC